MTETVNVNQAKEKTFKEKFGILITLFIKLDVREKATWKANDWGRERKACSILLKRYPDFDFFYFLPEFCDKFNSLLGLTSKDNKIKLDLKYKEWEDRKSKEFKLEEHPIIQLEFINKKPKNILEFLNYGTKN